MKNMEESYQSWYASSEKFRKVYSIERAHQYDKLLSIIKHTGAHTVLDIGCSYGQVVDNLNLSGIEAWGVDLPVPVLQEAHCNLQHSNGRFLYGSVNEDDFLDRLSVRRYDLLCLCHTIRHLTRPQRLSRLSPRWLMIQEGSDNLFNRRRSSNYDIPLWSPATLLKTFDSYFARAIWPTKFICRIDRPSSVMLSLVNLLPSFTILLEKKS